MKFKVGDQVRVTAGKDKGKTGLISRVVVRTDRVVVTGMNTFTKHVKPTMGRAGERVVLERPLPTASIAIINEKGEVDRIKMSVAKDGSKTRLFAKTGAVVPTPKQEVAKK
jgi:large subunit ribosomal protein L24